MKHLVIMILTGLMLQGCRAEDKSLFGCLTGMTGQGSVTVRLSASDNNLSLDQLCSAKVTLVYGEGSFGEGTRRHIRTLSPHEGNASCLFKENFLSEDGHPFDIEAHLSGYTVAQMTNVVQLRSCDHINLDLELQPSNISCPEGYTEANGECVTPYGCAFPQLQESYLSGNAALGWREPARCVDECTLAMGSYGGRCERVDEN